MNIEFTKLKKQDKIEFFIKCQEILAAHHPTSPFLATQSNIQERLSIIGELTRNYKGYVWKDDHCCILWNKIKINNPKDLVAALKEHKYQPPHPMYNAVAIDFVVVDNVKNLLPFAKANFDKNMLYALYIKEAKPKLFRTDYLMKHVLGIPIAGSPPLIKL